MRAPSILLLCALSVAACARARTEPSEASRDPLTIASTERDVVPTLVGRAAANQTAPAVAMGQGVALAAWQDLRAGAEEIFLTRWSTLPAPVAIDPYALRLTRGGSAYRPAVATNGTEFLVVWRDLSQSPQRIRAAWVDAQGALEPQDFNVTSFPTGARGQPAAGFDGQQYVVAWYDGRNGGDRTWYARISRDGGRLDGEGFQISEDKPGTAPAVPPSSLTGITLVVWSRGLPDGGTELAGRRMAPDGGSLDAVPFLVSPLPSSSASLAAADGGWVVTWASRLGTSDNLFAIRVADDGTPLDGAGILVAGDGGEMSRPWVVGLDQGGERSFEVYWLQSGLGVVSQPLGTFSAFGPVGPPVPRVAQNTTYLTEPAAAASNGDVALLWATDLGLGRPDILGNVTYGDGGSSSMGIVSRAATEQSAGGIAASPAGFLVAFREERAFDEPRMYAARIGLDGAQREDAGVLYSGTGNFGVESGEVAFDGTRFLATFSWGSTTQQDVRGAFIQPDGTVADGGDFLINGFGAVQHFPALAFDGTNYLVAWKDTRNLTVNEDIYAARVSPGGAVSPASGVPVRVNLASKSNPAVGAGGGTALVVWHEALDAGFSQVMAARFPSDGGPSSGPVHLFPESANQFAPQLSFDGVAFLVVYERASPGTTTEAWGVRVDPATGLPVGAGFRIAGGGAVNAGLPASAFNGTYHLVVFRARPGDRYQVVRVKPSGFVLDATPLELFQPDGGLLSRARLASAPNGETAVLYARYLDDPLYNAPRTRLLMMFGSPLGATCALGTDCESTFCVQNVCCQSPCVGGTCDATGTCTIGLDAGGTGGGAGGSGGTGGSGGAGGTGGSGGSSGGAGGTAGSTGATQLTVGCGCTAGANATLLWALALLATFRSRRRRVATRPSRPTQ